MSVTLTAQDQATIRTAAYGAVSLLAAASAKPSKAAISGTRALTSATGEIGHVLNAKSKDINLKGKTVAALADQVLPTLTEALTLLDHHNPTEAENFRTTLQVAIAAATDPATPATAEMARKLTAALHTA
ncbi:hypothetical protein [Nocardia sp. NBC_00511]|uniref:hypothetical protein n=1 Tax=Nocardia sp. NBC_00511 TaxID=2903591 RepID=UPI0030E06ABA